MGECLTRFQVVKRTSFGGPLLAIVEKDGGSRSQVPNRFHILHISTHGGLKLDRDPDEGSQLATLTITRKGHFGFKFSAHPVQPTGFATGRRPLEVLLLE